MIGCSRCDHLGDAVLAIEKREKIRIVVFIDDFDTLDGDQAEALTPYIDSDTQDVSVVGACSADKFSLAFKDNPKFIRRIRQAAPTIATPLAASHATA